jgi:EmrB/QacA subfamily drug resistance transporter
MSHHASPAALHRPTVHSHHGAPRQRPPHVEEGPAGLNDHDESRRPWTVLGLMLLAQIMVILDVSVVNVALPSIGRDLQFSSGDYQWMISAYVLLSGGLLLLGGRLADLFRRRSVFLTGLVVFTAASMTSGLSDGALQLILARAAQGTGAALLTPAALSIIMTTYAGKQRAAALSVWGAIGSSGIAVGVLFGGALTSWLGWQSVFFINVPIGIAVMVGTLRSVPPASRAGRARGRLDIPGAVILVAGLLVLVYGIEGTREHGWASTRTALLLGLAAALLAGFAVVERRSPAALIPADTWRMRSLVSASTVMAGITGVVVGAIFLTSLYLQRITGASALVAGLEFLPLAAAITLTAAVASKLLAHLGPRLMITVGLIVMAAGAFVLAASAGGTSYFADVLPGLLLLGAGTGPMFVAISVAAMSEVPAERSGLAGGVMMTGHEIGAALGVATLSAVGGGLLTDAALIDTVHAAFLVVVGVAAALVAITLVAVPSRVATGASHAHHH